jgi:glycosyltransferase involved in cell wall biosynthesis
VLSKLKRKVAVYHYSYLPLSETFIYRQLLGLSKNFNLNVLTHRLENLQHYQGIQPILLPKHTMVDRLFRRDRRVAEGYLKGCDLFHVNFGPKALAVQHYAERLGIPMSAYFLGFDASVLLKNTRYCNHLKKSIFRAVFVNSENMKQRLAPYLPSATKCYVAYCGIPLESFPFTLRREVPKGATFLQVCRLVFKKGIDITLNAFSLYRKKSDPEARLIIAGYGPLKDDLLRLSSSLGLKDSVSFLGPIGYNKYIELLETSDVFLQPSITAKDGDMEGIPTTICEAMACGLPVISTWHSGIPELIDDGENGFMVKERDIEGLFARMESLRTTDITEVSRNARIKIEERFDHNKTIDILSEYMHNIISERIREY